LTSPRPAPGIWSVDAGENALLLIQSAAAAGGATKYLCARHFAPSFSGLAADGGLIYLGDSSRSFVLVH
jgi:hypothetical protein